MIAGGWEYVELSPCSLPQKVATGWTEVMKNHVGSELTPVLYLGEQVVSGKNYWIICKARTVTPDTRTYIASVVLYENLEGEFSLGGIEEIEPPQKRS